MISTLGIKPMQSTGTFASRLYTMTELLPGTLERFFTQPMYLYLVPTHHFKPDDRLQDFEGPSHHDVPVHAMITVDHPLDYLRGSPILHLETV